MKEFKGCEDSGQTRSKSSDKTEDSAQQYNDLTRLTGTESVGGLQLRSPFAHCIPEFSVGERHYGVVKDSRRYDSRRCCTWSRIQHC